ncbi:hypothetical protein [Photobacterium sp. OFAV2-7]|uniref:hypothetical protein n=1 Tax=Photobacterium sp. OFAV2-7 TaxID=2917748 RepID=UPI001EF505AD|nr:hypothetical protein [Photobacterium sp. OFAV2-7]MCG7584581.1 hypothetical protein [Photobacterium sp. OFAV2-7]
MRKIVTYLSLDPRKGLGHQPLFWLAILAPIGIALGLGIPVWLDYRLAFTSEAYQTFLIISKLPIGISSLAIPLGILVGRLHGTNQTARQIENTQQDNKTKLYLAHFEHFCTHIDFVETAILVKFERLFVDNKHPKLDKLAMYKLLYPNNSLTEGVEPMSHEFRYSAAEHVCQIAEGLKEVQESGGKRGHIIKNKCDSMRNVCFRFNDDLVFLERLLEDSKDFLQYREFFKGFNNFKDFNDENDLSNLMSKRVSHFELVAAFYLELLDEIESFEINDVKQRIVSMSLTQYRDLYMYHLPFHLREFCKQSIL